MAEEADDLHLGTDIPKSVTAKAADQIRVRNPNRFQSIYANNVTISFSSFDMSITFGEVAGEQDGKPIVEEAIKVTLTREMGKAFSRLLTANIEAFEKSFGKIVVPDILKISAEGSGAEETEDSIKVKPKTKQGSK